MIFVLFPLYIMTMMIIINFVIKRYDMDAKVRQFTKDSGFVIPNKPTKMTFEQGKFISSMIISEVVELLQTFDLSQEEISEIIIGAVEKDRSDPPDLSTDARVMANQIDAFVDIVYYILNCTNKLGYVFREYFDEVHNANMRKKINGRFIKRDDGKIQKPIGWTEPNILAIVQRNLYEA